MLTKLAVIGLVMAVLASAPAVSAADSTSLQRTVQLEHTVQTLRAELHATRSRLAAANRKVAKARAKVSSLTARLAAVPTALDQAERKLEREVKWAEKFAPASYSPGELTALAAMDYVSTHVSSTAAVFSPPVALPRVRDHAAYANAILTAGVGECSYHVLVFDALMTHFGYRTRPVSFYYHDPWTQAPGAHSAVEVLYDGGWHYFDPTYSVYWTEPTTSAVLDLTTERRLGNGVEHKNNGLFLNLFENPFYNGDTTGFQTDPATNVVIG